MSEYQSEDYILEQLNQEPYIHGLLLTARTLISKSVNKLMMRVFRKEKHAIKFVIPSLVDHNGPLNDLSVRLKLLYALSIISREEYEDIELLMAVLDELNSDSKEYTYTDDEILGPISLLHDMLLPPNLPTKRTVHMEIGIVDSMKSSLYSQRYQQVIRSSLIIAITALIDRINHKQS